MSRVLDERLAHAMILLNVQEDDDVFNTSLRFPHSLRGIAGEDHRYALPSVVAIGPWCNPNAASWTPNFILRARGLFGRPAAGRASVIYKKFWHLNNMEHTKCAAAYWFCCRVVSGRSTSEVYEKVLSVAVQVRGYYGESGDDLSDDAELATMMLVDGCFLLQYMTTTMMGGAGTDPLLRKRMSPPNIRKDIFMLENQIPYLVLEALMEVTTSVDVRGFVAKMAMELFRPRNNLLLAREREVLQPQPQARRSVQLWGCIPFPAQKRAPTPTAESGGGGDRAQDYKPPHLLGLLLFYVTGSAPEAAGVPSSSHHEEGEGSAPEAAAHEEGEGSAPSSQPRSAAELARIGVKLTPALSATARLADMAFTRKPVLFAELSLSPLFLSDDTACWLVNMAALEEAVEARSFIPMGASPQGLKLSSYLSVLAMLVDGEEDVRELRRANLLHGTLSNTQVLAFFKGLGHNLRLGSQYHAVLEQIDRYRRDRSVRIAIYRFAYDNYKTIAAVLSITGVLIGIFKTLLDLSSKQH